MSEPTAGGSGSEYEHLPFGVDANGHVVVARAGEVIELGRLTGLDIGPDIWNSGSLNAFMALGPDAWRRTRSQLAERVDNAPTAARRRRGTVPMSLPFEVADYVDFYSSEQHATTMGRLLRPDGPHLPAAWKELPIGYHGRAGTVVVSGERIQRPCGLRRVGDLVSYGPSIRLDVEVELGFVVGVGSVRGTPVSTEAAADHVFGVTLLNDWSARDIQAFEYQPLGPFLGKSFATSVGAWVVPLSALDAWRVPGPAQDPVPSRYLLADEPRGLAIELELSLNGTVVSRMNSAGLYWSMSQQLAHMTANGASLRTGDLFATGTISGVGSAAAGSLMELTSAGADPLKLGDGRTRAWLEDGDTVSIRGWCHGASPVSFGEVVGTIVGGPSTP